MDAETITGAFIGFAIVMGWGYYAHYSDKKKSEKQKAEREARKTRDEVMMGLSKLDIAGNKLWKQGRYAESIATRKKELAMWKEYEALIDDEIQLKRARRRISELEAIVADPKY